MMTRFEMAVAVVVVDTIAAESADADSDMND